MGEIDTNEFNTFSKLMKESLYKSLNELCNFWIFYYLYLPIVKLIIIWKISVSQSDILSSIEINDNLLNNLLEFPSNAFEIVLDHKRQKKLIQVKKIYLERKLSGNYFS